MMTEKLELACAKMTLGLLPLESLPDIAVLALEDGCDTPSLQMLAGLTEAELCEGRTLFEKVIRELRIEVPDKHDSVLNLAAQIAGDVLGGAKAPYDGAREIWDACLCVPEERFPELDTFVYAASEWADRPEDHGIFKDGIIAAAKDLKAAGE